MANALSVSVISPEKVLFTGSASTVVVPTFDGEVGILPMHAPLMAVLGRGTLRVDTAEGVRRFKVDGGFMQVVDDTVRVVTENASEQ